VALLPTGANLREPSNGQSPLWLMIPCRRQVLLLTKKADKRYRAKARLNEDSEGRRNYFICSRIYWRCRRDSDSFLYRSRNYGRGHFRAHRCIAL
jgi:hypothetical protein